MARFALRHFNFTVMNFDTKCCGTEKNRTYPFLLEKPIFQSTKCCVLEKQRQRGFNPCDCKRLELLINLHKRL